MQQPSNSYYSNRRRNRRNCNNSNRKNKSNAKKMRFFASSGFCATENWVPFNALRSSSSTKCSRPGNSVAKLTVKRNANFRSFHQTNSSLNFPTSKHWCWSCGKTRTRPRSKNSIKSSSKCSKPATTAPDCKTVMQSHPYYSNNNNRIRFSKAWTNCVYWMWRSRRWRVWRAGRLRRVWNPGLREAFWVGSRCRRCRMGLLLLMARGFCYSNNSNNSRISCSGRLARWAQGRAATTLITGGARIVGRCCYSSLYCNSKKATTLEIIIMKKRLIASGRWCSSRLSRPISSDTVSPSKSAN